MSRRKSNKKQIKIVIEIVILVLIIIIGFCNKDNIINNNTTNDVKEEIQSIPSILGDIPEYSGTPYVIVNNNIPEFDENDYTKGVFENYSELDKLGRCGVAYANICLETMPKENAERGNISSIHPSGWQTAKYENLVEGDYLYNRCHLIGWQLSAEDANELNLITGTRYMNVEGMLPFENMVDDYIEANRRNHVLYRVTPIYQNNNLVANGVQMEAFSIEDNGEGVCFNVYVYNVQPGVIIDYATGESHLKE